MVKLSSPRLDLKCDVSLKQIAVAGDILEICEEYYLNMLTIYGRLCEGKLLQLIIMI